MTTEPATPHFVRKQETFVGRFAAATAWLSGDLPEWGELPEWLAQEFLGEVGKIDRIIKKFGLPPERRNDLLAVPLALDACLLKEARKSARQTEVERRAKRKLLQLKNRLYDALEAVDEVATLLLPHLITSLGEPTKLATGDLEYHLEPGPAILADRSISDLLHRIDELGPLRAAPDYVYWAHWTLSAIVASCKVDLTPAQLTALGDELLAEVRRHYGHKPRTGWADNDQIPRQRDLVSRVAARESNTSGPLVSRRKSSSRKTRQTSG